MTTPKSVETVLNVYKNYMNDENLQIYTIWSVCTSIKFNNKRRQTMFCQFQQKSENLEYICWEMLSFNCKKFYEKIPIFDKLKVKKLEMNLREILGILTLFSLGSV